MKILSIGDIHGTTHWKTADISKHDKVVFSGDYVDDWSVPDELMLYNLREIINLKKEYKDKVVLLLGNHDLMYMFLGKKAHSCSGYRPTYAEAVHYMFEDNKDLFQFAYGIISNAGKDVHLWTHAGIVQSWYVTRFVPYIEKAGLKDIPIYDQLQCAFRDYEPCLFDVGYYRGGYMPTGGPVWADAQELFFDPLPNIHQIVGHTRVGELRTHDIDGGSITFIDTQQTNKEFYELELR